ncbi:imidazole glycerol phosphate synthase subunit HisH [Sphingomonas sp. LHG3406-1]|uniref:imidazole glycerol phosphate synthase subunit HisH n=1 Tax=Sphingomonas sp. LHG3406-1 TaxID=2804617 RepID=UPI0026364096|nr:imidazole glycerol phosphate synthase subunit HisH [Sphingomonas sp. LHG3406-1]
MSARVTLVDVGYGNINSIETALRRLGAEVVRSGDPQGVAMAERLLLPGVGAAGYAMERIDTLGLAPALKAYRRPALGICLGMHLLFERSEEGDVQSLGLIPGVIRRLASAPGLTVPHMGWSRLEVLSEEAGINDGDYVYFAHSYAAEDGPATIARALHGTTIPAIVRSANWTGAQFHPERSGAAGARFLKAWLDA